ncbi:tRNA (adenosine(37)-N6)-threonylcarbamoyltransferase complex dimerization subunit type 1 TsaB [Brachybacterium vulturis]|uniref:tRNA (Adenosine(37)-N6)-threonylcarbamoyltransferase complex dimerization subunit type 1 TsaB n=1 Tax=Brachybacterium vulturis TaxID=2017484 RepID=A0A291GLV2_9MICO|nr:tRNA (adenosine(37)-N6)-threonylcarbamoyltransferase complex dimerization subunit type 1 TsaB [Brachybacterium vulturis]ATG51339.1 tRNA (adenosine(37)-N6)-threonylcarbamoyltransferase complex dimerization subunit type 1 TsaB [Brachybacterium vulturis]
MLLGIDTSGAVSTAVARGELTGPAPEILQVRSDERSRHHDEVLLDLIDQTLQAAGVERTELTGVVVGRGPGPFTGLRVGLVSARSIAAVLGVPLHGLSSLDALAHQALAALGPAPEGPVSVGVALDARRREVYHARYRRESTGEVTRTAEPAVHTPADVADELTACDVLVGSGTGIYPELLPATMDLVHVDAGHLILAAAALSARGEDLSSTEPMYLREPDAAKPTARKSALGR